MSMSVGELPAAINNITKTLKKLNNENTSESIKEGGINEIIISLTDLNLEYQQIILGVVTGASGGIRCDKCGGSGRIKRR